MSYKVAIRGILHCSGVMLVTMTIFLVAAKSFGLTKSNTEALTGLSYIFAVGILGYIWKLKNGKTFSFSDYDANKNLLSYSFGAAIVLVGVMLSIDFKTIVSAGTWWPLALVLLIPLGLFAQTANFSILIVIGGWFCRK